MRRLIKGESGSLLISVLVILVLGSFIMVPLLNMAATSTGYHETVERNTVETYSAEAGVEYALGKLGNSPDTYMTSDLNHTFTTNNKTVNVNASYQGSEIFLITSTATTDTDVSTTIESYVELAAPDYSFIPDNAITSPNDIEIQPGCVVNGDVQYNGNFDNKGILNGNESTEPIPWPLIKRADEYFWNDVQHLESYPADSIDLKFISNLGPMYKDGDFTVTNSKMGGAYLQLDGTIYITGNLVFQQPGTKKAYTLDLHDQTIFVEGDITFPSDRIHIFGNGCIIAMGDIDFQPSVTSAFNHFVFVMSIDGTVNFQPSGDFTGSLAGDTLVNMQPGSSITWIEPPWDSLNIPQGDFDDGNYGGSTPMIVTWQIK